MKLYEKEFEDNLEVTITSDGKVNFNSSKPDIAPFDILKGYDEELYSELFNVWYNDLKDRRLESAEEILGENENQRRFKMLQGLYNTNNLIPFIGAGLSIPSGYEGWTSFLYRLAETYNIDISHLINSGDYEGAASKIADDIGMNAFNTELNERLGVHDDVFGAVRILPECFPECSIITTNFDGLLKECFDESHNSFAEYLDGSNIEDIGRLISDGERCLIKIHGKANSSKNRIITKEEYDIHYSNEGCLSNAIRQITTRNSLLFIGCSLGLDRTIKVMQRLNTELGTEYPIHYAFLPVPDEISTADRRKELSKANIYPIFYNTDDFDHDDAISALLEKLMVAKG